jgi:hypothetical protein
MTISPFTQRNGIYMTNFFFKIALIGFLFCQGCGSAHPVGAFEVGKAPVQPDYSSLANWAAHPDKKDPADQVPCPVLLKDEQATAPIDVFFLYPTTYTGDLKHQKNWNAPIDDSATNDKTDNSAILFQASIFNAAGKVYAPRYRQAHFHSFFTKDKASAKQALELAYSDVKAAFEHYLKYWNNGRPFILAGHSQGGLHTMHLLKEIVEQSPLRKQLVVAYAVGYPLPNDFFAYLKACETPDQTGCFCTWRTFERDYGLKNAREPNVVCTNPLTWTISEDQYAPATLNKGGVVRPFCAIYPGIADAQVHKGVLLSKKPKFPGSVLMRTHNYHPGDLNLYYLNIRENAQQRAQAYLKGMQGEYKQD